MCKVKYIIYMNAYDKIKPYFTMMYFMVFLFCYDVMIPEYMNWYGSYFVLMYMLIDFVMQPQMTFIYKLHHFIAMMLCYKDMTNPSERLTIDSIVIRRVLFQTEYSTIVLSICQVVPKYIKVYLGPIFLILFLYFRIYKFVELYCGSEYIEDIQVFRDVNMLSLYCMNTYWTFQICRKFKVNQKVLDMSIVIYMLYVKNNMLRGITFISYVMDLIKNCN